MTTEYLILFDFFNNSLIYYYILAIIIFFLNSTSDQNSSDFFPVNSGGNNGNGLDNWWKRFLDHLYKYRYFYLSLITIFSFVTIYYLLHSNNIISEPTHILNNILINNSLSISDQFYANYVINFDNALNVCLNQIHSTGFLENQSVVVEGNFLNFNFRGNHFIFPKHLLGINDDSHIIISRSFYIGLYDCPPEILNNLNSHYFLTSVDKFIIFVYSNYPCGDICINFNLTEQQFLQFIVCFCLHQFVENYNLLLV